MGSSGRGWEGRVPGSRRQVTDRPRSAGCQFIAPCREGRRLAGAVAICDINAARRKPQRDESMAKISPLAPAQFPALAPVAGVFTRALTAGAPVLWCREVLPGGRVRAIVVNSGNANVFTGRDGRNVVEAIAASAARCLGCSPREVFVSSTGVIGEKLPGERITAAMPAIVKTLAADAWEKAARAIMTTDTF